MAIKFCFHKYAPWSEIVQTYDSPKQFTYCVKCNKIISRNVKHYNIEVNTHLWNHKFEKQLEE